ncbi:MAG: tRNA (guanine(26)-N(2))-dimethyltransferase [Nanoarchaeota archaeon]
MEIIYEGSIKLKIDKAEKISKEMQVFYNPAMRLNRDISVLLLNSINKNRLQIADLLAATGVRSIRFLRELNKNKIKSMYINDYNEAAVKLVRENLKLNGISCKNNKISITQQEANLFLLNSTGFDYIDLDPFGCPNFALDAACKRIARNGILAVTATDTSALCGTYPNACIRKYWAIPKKDVMMHETGLRILIRKIQMIAGQYDKALFPIFSYSKDHYMRVFLASEKGKGKVEMITKMHGQHDASGPMWLGNLWSKNLVEKMYQNAIKNKLFKKNHELVSFLQLIRDESKINSIGIYDLHDICKKNKIRNSPKKEAIILAIRKIGYKASKTHFKGQGIRSNVPYSKLVNLIKNK